MDALEALNLGEREKVKQGKTLLNAVVGILSRVCEANIKGLATETKAEIEAE